MPPNFVYDNLSLNNVKQNRKPLPVGEDPNKWVQAVQDWNPAMNASLDLRGAVINGTFLGLQQQALEPAVPVGGSADFIWLDNTGILWAKINAVSYNLLVGGGGGTVTSVGTGVGLTGGPIVASGTIALANTAVIPGAYVNASLTVDAQGRLTAASSGIVGTPTTRNIFAGGALTGGGDLSADRTISLAPLAPPPTGGPFTNSTVTVDQFGRVTAAASGTAPAPAIRQINTGTGLQGGGDLTADRTLSLANTTVVAGAYTYSSITVDAQGRLTAAASGVTPVAATRQVIAGTGLTGGGNLSADVTLNLGNTAVVPGAYTNSNITIDAQGRITLAANGGPGGGGTVTSVGSGTGLTGGPITGAGTLSLANTAVTPGSFTSANITVDAQGRLTAASSGGGGGTVTNVATGAGLTGGPITATGTISLANTTVTPGSFTYSSITVDAQGRLTAASSGAAPVPTSRIIAAGTGLTGGGDLTIDRTLSLTNTGVGAAVYTLPTITVDAQGRITAAASGTAGTVTNVATGTGLTGGPITTTGTVSLANTTVTPGSFTSANITVDAQGRITAAANGGGAGVTSVTAGAGLTGGGTGAVTLDVGAAFGVTVAADSVAVNTAATFTAANAWTGAHAFNNNVTIGDAAADILSIPASVSGDVTFTADANHVVSVANSTAPQVTGLLTVRGANGILNTRGGTVSLFGGTGNGAFGGGDILVTAGTSGASAGATGAAIQLQAASGNGAAGGQISILSGNSNSGAFSGGAIILSTGTSASAANPSGGIGLTTAAGALTGAITIQTGIAASASPAGSVAITGGANSSTGTGGAVALTAGNSTGGNGGAINLNSGNGSAGVGGAFNAFAGTGSVTGGAVTIAAGANTATGSGGQLTLSSGAGGATSGNGGSLVVQSGAAVGTSGVGGVLSVAAGVGRGALAGGTVSVFSGQGGVTGAGGNINVTTGAGGATSGNSGNLGLDVGTVTSGTLGTISIGITSASAISISRTGVLTTVQGSLTVQQDLTVNGNTSLGNATTDTILATAQILGNLVFTNTSAHIIKLADSTAAGGQTMFLVGGNGGGVNNPGGIVQITGGNATAGDANGGAVSVNAGAGFGTGTGGSLILAAGSGGTNGGAASITGGLAGTSGVGGTVTISASNNGAINTSFGRQVLIVAGNGGGGAAGATGFGGAINLNAGSAISGDSPGGAINLTGGLGQGTITGIGGAINLTTGQGGNVGIGSESGVMTLTSGSASGTAANSGAVNLLSGTAAGTGGSGRVTVKSGVGAFSGDVRIETGVPSASISGEIRLKVAGGAGAAGGAGGIFLEGGTGSGTGGGTSINLTCGNGGVAGNGAGGGVSISGGNGGGPTGAAGGISLNPGSDANTFMTPFSRTARTFIISGITQLQHTNINKSSTEMLTFGASPPAAIGLQTVMTIPLGTSESKFIKVHIAGMNALGTRASGLEIYGLAFRFLGGVSVSGSATEHATASPTVTVPSGALQPDPMGNNVLIRVNTVDDATQWRWVGRVEISTCTNLA